MIRGRNNNNFLCVILQVVVATSVLTLLPQYCSARRSIRGYGKQEEARHLKTAKAKSSKNSGVSATPNNQQYVSQTATIKPTPAFDPNGTSQKAWDMKCPAESNNLDKCVGGGTNAQACKQCIMGQASLTTTSPYGLNQCANPALGDHCKGCKPQLLDYYNCGAGTNIGAPPSAITVPNENPQPAPGLGGSGITVPITADVSSGTVVDITGYNPNQNECPVNQPSFGDSCDGATGAYQYIKCIYATHICTCNSNEPSAKWVCNA